MNKIISTIIIAITVMALTSCNSGHSSKQDEVTTSEKQDSIRQANAEADSIKKAQEEQARLEADSMKKVQEEQARLEAEREAKKWKGATSRSDLKSKLNDGTIPRYSTGNPTTSSTGQPPTEVPTPTADASTSLTARTAVPKPRTHGRPNSPTCPKKTSSTSTGRQASTAACSTT